MQRWILLPGAPPGLPRDFTTAWETLRGRVVDRNRFRHVERVTRKEGALFVKFFHRPRWSERLRNLLVPPRASSLAGREVKAAALLEAAGLEAVPMAAYGEERLGPLERRSLLVTREVPGPSLGEVLRRDPAEGARLAPALEELLRRLLEHRIYLPDLSVEHVLLPPGGGLVLLDLHNARRLRRWRTRPLARMLGRLWAGARGSVPPGRALRLALRLFPSARPGPPAREVLAEAARRGERWERRERRKRREDPLRD